jgi:hypothetical protein
LGANGRAARSAVRPGIPFLRVRLGQAPTISQSGTKLELNIDKNELADGKLTSNITVSAGPPFNAEGLIRPDHSIEWSNGTKWLKQ